MDIIELIKAVVSLWPIGLEIIALIVLIFYRKEVKSFFVGLWNIRYKKGDTEFQLERDKPSETPDKDLEESSSEVEEPREGVLPPSPQSLVKDADALKTELFNAYYIENNSENIEGIFQELQNAEQDTIEKTRNEAFYNYSNYVFGLDSDAINKLETLSENENVRNYVLTLMAMCYVQVNNHREAIKIHERALSYELDEESKANHIVEIAKLRSQLGNSKEGIEYILEKINQFESNESRVIIFNALADL